MDWKTLNQRPGERFFVVIEGINGTGKTSVGRRLAQELAGSFYSTPPGSLASIRKWIDSYAMVECRYIFYLTALALAAKEIRQLLNHGSVVCDRYLQSTIAYHRALGLPEEFLEIADRIDLPTPSDTFYLDCQEAERQRRLGQRGASLIDAKHTEIADHIREEFLRFDMVHIQTDSMDEEEVVRSILSYLRQ